MQTQSNFSEDEKNGLWGWWHNSQRWQDALHRKAAHKALDIEDEMSISSASTNYGIGWKELLVIGAIIAGTAYGVLQLTGMGQSQPPIAPVAAPAMPGDAEYDVLFYDQDGNPIQVDRWSGTPP